MKRVAVLLIALLVGVVAFYEFGNVAVCDGWYDLTVEIDTELAARVSHVSFVGVGNAGLADSFIAMVDKLINSMEHHDSAKPFTVNVGFSYRASNLGRTWGHVQEYSHLIVVLHRNDCTRTVHRLAVPHRDVSRRIVVSAASAT